ncbi:MAG TPA: lantibiotic dehydratase family protein, partial [Verrucomicrobiae bacterium]|nr:lantibiotic dehydratase family protein [Verrucomicrobiae bacterium]
MKQRSLYDLTTRPLVVARVPSVPAAAAVRVLAAAEPLEAARAFYAGDAFARAALAVSSPTLAKAVDEWIAGRPCRNPKTPLRALSYLVRMATRSTPFGLFAGVEAVDLAERTSLVVDEAARRTRTRPDMALLCRLAEVLEAGDLRGRVSYVTNACAFVRGERLYVTNVALSNYTVVDRIAKTEQREVSLKHTAAVAFVRELCAQPVPYDRIARELAVRFEAPFADASRLLDRLVEAGVVISELRASPLGDPVAYLLERFEALGAPFAAALREAVEEAARVDAIPLAARSARDHAELHDRLAGLVEPATPFAVQIDMRAGVTGALSRALLDDAELLVDSYVRMGRAMTLQAFRERFLARYEGSERMVPLLELVDNNLGLGLPDKTAYAGAPNPERDALVLRLVSEALRTNAEEIVLEGELLERFLPPVAPADRIAPSLEIGFAIAASSAEAIDRGDYQVVSGFVSDVATRSLGRFATLLGDGVTARMREIARASLAQGEFAAEFAYAPPSTRAYNVSIRPLLFDCEVRAGIGEPASGDRLDLADLWVGVEEERFFLWSQSRGRRVGVRETHALTTYSSAPNLCRLLALLHADGRRFPGVDWGPAQEFPYLPRLRRGRVVLSPRRWRFSRAQFGVTAAQAQREFERLRPLWNLPRYLYLCEEDNRLLLDLDSNAN